MNLFGLAACIAAFGTILQIVLTYRRDMRLNSKVEAVHGEVKTANGITMAVLSDRAEGRRIEADVAHDKRTISEQHYVDELHAPTDADGNPPPVAQDG
jgi:hypothetical protein